MPRVNKRHVFDPISFEDCMDITGLTRAELDKRLLRNRGPNYYYDSFDGPRWFSKESVLLYVADGRCPGPYTKGARTRQEARRLARQQGCRNYRARLKAEGKPVVGEH